MLSFATDIALRGGPVAESGSGQFRLRVHPPSEIADPTSGLVMPLKSKWGSRPLSEFMGEPDPINGGYGRYPRILTRTTTPRAVMMRRGTPPAAGSRRLNILRKRVQQTKPFSLRHRTTPLIFRNHFPKWRIRAFFPNVRRFMMHAGVDVVRRPFIEGRWLAR